MYLLSNDFCQILTNTLLKAQEAFQGMAEELGIKNEYHKKS